MESHSAIVGCLPHECDGIVRKAGPIVVAMSPLKTFMLAFVPLDFRPYTFVLRAWIWHSLVPKMKSGRHHTRVENGGFLYLRGPC